MQIWERPDKAPDERFVTCAKGDVERRPVSITVGETAELRAYGASSCLQGDAEKGSYLAAITVAAIGEPALLPPPGIGVNAVTMSNMFLGYAPRGDGSPEFIDMSRRLARKSIADAADSGIPFMRVGMGGWFPSPIKGDFADTNALRLWLHDPEAYWRQVDVMMDALDEADIRIVPALFWAPSIFTALAGDTTTVTLRDPKSRSYRLLSQYVREFIARYRARRTILFYELTIELDAGANLDRVSRCAKRHGGGSAACAPVGNYSTNDLIAFASRLSGLIRTLDPLRPISSGYAMSHRFAAHMERSPEWTEKPGFEPDSRADFVAYASDIHQGFDLVSYHPFNGRDNNERLGHVGNENAGFLEVVDAAAAEMGKQVFIGAFGDQDPPVSEDPSARFTRAVLGEIVTLGIPYGCVFAWELYYNPARAWSVSLEPGSTDAVIDLIAATNAKLGRALPQRQRQDDEPPRIVVTTAVAGTPIARFPAVHAVVSDDSSVARVTFALDGAPEVEATRDGPFYTFDVRPDRVAEGSHTLVTRAYDDAGNRSEEILRIEDGMILP